jgi:hypothetical protein
MTRTCYAVPLTYFYRGCTHMKCSTFLAAALAAGLIAATPVLAADSTTKPTAEVAKQPTAGGPVGSTPQRYGNEAQAQKQQTAGAPVGFKGGQSGSGEATKQ